MATGLGKGMTLDTRGGKEGIDGFRVDCVLVVYSVQ